jgi:hypothetical protein
MYEDVEKFCAELKGGALEGPCDCVCEGVVQLLEEKVELCFRRPPLKSELDRSIPKSWIRTVQECEKLSPCHCPVSSLYALAWD